LIIKYLAYQFASKGFFGFLSFYEEENFEKKLMSLSVAGVSLKLMYIF